MEILFRKPWFTFSKSGKVEALGPGAVRILSVVAEEVDKDGTPISPWAMLRKMGLKEIGTESLSNLFTLMSALESLDCLRFSTERVENSFYTETHMFIDLTGRGHALVMGVRSIQNHARSVQSPESDLAGA